MTKNNQIAFLGGDRRQYIAATALSSLGWRVCGWGIRDADGALAVDSDISSLLNASDVIVLPIPVSFDSLTLNALPSKDGEAVRLERIIRELSEREGALVIGGKFPPSFVRSAEEAGIECVDLLTSEDFLYKNAYITAEAALAVAMDNMKRTVRGASFAITGYGRIARSLARLLCALGGRVSVYARREKDIAEAELAGCRGVSIANEKKTALLELAERYDVIFNTVPSLLLDGEILRRMSGDSLIVELASAPGGVDSSVARELGVRVLWASSLPGKYAPRSAGLLVAECVLEILGEGR